MENIVAGCKQCHNTFQQKFVQLWQGTRVQKVAKTAELHSWWFSISSADGKQPRDESSKSETNNQFQVVESDFGYRTSSNIASWICSLVFTLPSKLSSNATLQIGSSAGSCKPSMYGCSKACSTVMRLLGLNSRSFSIRSTACTSKRRQSRLSFRIDAGAYKHVPPSKRP